VIPDPKREFEIFTVAPNMEKLTMGIGRGSSQDNVKAGQGNFSRNVKVMYSYKLQKCTYN